MLYRLGAYSVPFRACFSSLLNIIPGIALFALGTHKALLFASSMREESR
jgi:hypothetical protein